MSLLPLFIDIKDKPCLIVGGGKIAARKLKMLCKAEADITIIAPLICEEIQALVETHSLRLNQREFTDADINKQNLIIAATSDSPLNKHISDLAKLKNILVNVADDFKQGDVVLPGRRRPRRLDIRDRCAICTPGEWGRYRCVWC